MSKKRSISYIDDCNVVRYSVERGFRPDKMVDVFFKKSHTHFVRAKFPDREAVYCCMT